jgi:acyl-coenzyme A synthetase/AMP-(fatty) acid ligase
MTSLVFRALDQHVVGGLADNPAIEDERGAMSFAQLLHESASVAGAINQLGVTTGTTIALDLPDGRERVIAVLACARLGAVPDAAAIEFRLTGEPPAFHTTDSEVSWDLLIRAGRNDPAPAPDKDPDGYEQVLLEAYGDVFGPLTAGRAI